MSLSLERHLEAVQTQCRNVLEEGGQIAFISCHLLFIVSAACRAVPRKVLKSMVSQLSGKEFCDHYCQSQL